MDNMPYRVSLLSLVLSALVAVNTQGLSSSYPSGSNGKVNPLIKHILKMYLYYHGERLANSKLNSYFGTYCCSNWANMLLVCTTDNPEDCRNAETCSSDQVCSVQEAIAPHGDVYFWSGCEDLSICEDLSYTGTLNQIIGKRQASSQHSRCSYCCDGDMCNRNCTSFVNLALHKPAYQSSVAYNGPANLAVDGDTTKDYFKGSCTHTKQKHYPWWAVDLKNDYRITKVKLHERNDAELDDRSFHLKILVSSVNATKLNRDSTLFTQCGYYFGHSSDGNAIVIDCPRNTHGRWVRVQQSDPQYEHMHLCLDFKSLRR